MNLKTDVKVDNRSSIFSDNVVDSTVGEIPLKDYRSVKGHLPWTEAGVELLANIYKSVAKNGGRIRTGFLITNKEAPDWFDPRILSYFRKRRSKNLRKKAGTDQHRVARFYSEDAINTIKELWPNYNTTVICNIVGGTPHGIRYVAKRNMTFEEYDNHPMLNNGPKKLRK